MYPILVLKATIYADDTNLIYSYNNVRKGFRTINAELKKSKYLFLYQATIAEY